MPRDFIETGDNLPTTPTDPNSTEGQPAERQPGPEDREGDLDEKARRERREERRQGNPVKTQ